MSNNSNFGGTQKIDLKRIFLKKNPKLAPYIPGFVYRYLNRILHIKEINEFLAKNGMKTGYDFVAAIIEEFNVTTSIIGKENLPDQGRFIFASNHPLGGFDGMLLIKLLIEKYGNVKSISNDILMNMQNINMLFLPINKHGSQSFSSARHLDEVMSSEIQILTFPAGLVSRKRRGVIRDIDWKKNFIGKAIQHKRDVVPIHITGNCTNFFYRLANLRKFLRIKSNIEMFYLADETYQHRNKQLVITIGQPVSWQTFDRSKKPAEWALLMQDYVYSLGRGETKAFPVNK